MTQENTDEAVEVGQEVLVCDGTSTGTFGVVGGFKGMSVAVCVDGGGHDCDGMCPNGGVYEPSYALLPIPAANKRAAELLVMKLQEIAHIRTQTEERVRGEWNEVRDRLLYFYGQTDGTYSFPNSREGDLLKMVNALLSNPTNQ